MVPGLLEHVLPSEVPPTIEAVDVGGGDGVNVGSTAIYTGIISTTHLSMFRNIIGCATMNHPFLQPIGIGLWLCVTPTLWI